MLYNQLPNTFLKVPDLGKIRDKPTDPYDLGTIGMLHTSKFKEIVRLVVEGSDDFDNELSIILQGHRLQGTLNNLEIDELADFCRHISLANKSIVGWEFVDELTYLLEKKYTPRWELPNLEYDSAFREIFLSRVTWEPSDNMREQLKLFFKEYEEKTSHPLDMGQSFDIEDKKIWSFKNLYIIFTEISYLLSNFKGILDVNEFLPLQNQIENLLMDNYRNKIYSLEQRSSLLFLTINGMLNSVNDDYGQVQILLDNAYNLIRQFPEHQFNSYRWIFGFTYAIFSNYLFKSTSDLVIRRDLVAELIQDFYKPNEVDLDFWSKHLSRSKPHPLLMSIIIQGYHDLAKMIYDHAMEIPPSPNQDELLSYFNNLVKFLYNLINEYLKVYYGINIEGDIEETQSKINQNLKLTISKRAIISGLVFSTKWCMIIDRKPDKEKLELIRVLSTTQFGSSYARLQVIDTRLLLEDIDFKTIVEQIAHEAVNSDSIILSETFEDEVISVIGELFGAVQNKFKEQDETDIHSYEIVLLFTYMWLYHFSNYAELKYEGMMMLSPIISICYIQIARGYYERNNLEAAYLTYFNNHYLIEYVNTEIADHLRSDQTTQSKMIEKFGSVIKEWDIEFVIKEDYIKRISSNLDIKIKDRARERENKTFSMSGMLQDEVVIGYLDMVANLEDFLAQVPEKIDHNFINIIVTSDLYSDPDHESIIRQDHLGLTNSSLPFPIIRNINMHAIAIKLYPIDVQLPGTINFAKFLEDSGLTKS